MSAPALSIFGGVLEGEALNTADDFATGVVFFAFTGNGSVFGGCVRLKQAVGSRAGEMPMEVGPPLAYHGPAFDHALLADFVRWYWTTTRAEFLESIIGGSKNIPGSILRVNLRTNLVRQVTVIFDREWFQRRRNSVRSCRRSLTLTAGIAIQARMTVIPRLEPLGLRSSRSREVARSSSPSLP